MTDLEISKALARAIGWKARDIRAHHTLNGIQCNAKVPLDDDMCIPNWRLFDYRNWNVIGPIAEKFDCFPRMNEFGNWDVVGTDLMLDSVWNEDTPQKAIALAVIGAQK